MGVTKSVTDIQGLYRPSLADYRLHLLASFDGIAAWTYPADAPLVEMAEAEATAAALRLFRLAAACALDQRISSAIERAGASPELRRPGPSRQPQSARAIRDSRLRRIQRQHHANLSDAGAAAAKFSDGLSYAAGQYQRSDGLEAALITCFRIPLMDVWGKVAKPGYGGCLVVSFDCSRRLKKPTGDEVERS